MQTHTANIRWNRAGNDLAEGRYGTSHVWQFDGGASIPASASPHVLEAPYSDPAAVDPEEALVAAASSCHMLFFLFFADRAGHVVEDYSDDAEGVMERNEEGKMAITTIRLKPQIRYSGDGPGAEAEATLHEKSHAACFIANSIKAKVEVKSD